MLEPNAPMVFDDLVAYAKGLRADDWEPFRPGVTAHWLYKEPNGGASAVLLRYEPGARVAEHEHVGYEQMLVLSGDEYDEHGTYPAGSLVSSTRRARVTHRGARRGCVALLLIYEKPVRFVAAD